MGPNCDAVIVGAGAAGLRCALELKARGLKLIIFEASDHVGGRIRTDLSMAFISIGICPPHGLRRVSPVLDTTRYDLEFRARSDGLDRIEFENVSDPWRRPGSLLKSACSPIGSLGDKLRIAKLRNRLVRTPVKRIYDAGEDASTIEYLRNLGYSDRFLRSFLRPFYGGIFLEQELVTSRIMFEFVFKMFAQGYAALPEGGMGSIPEQMASRLPSNAVHLNSPIAKVEPQRVRLVDGSEIRSEHVVLATDMASAASLTGDQTMDRGWNETHCLYYSSPRSPLTGPYIALNGSPFGKIANVAVPSDALRDTLRMKIAHMRHTKGPASAEDISMELRSWFGSRFVPLSRRYTISSAPRQLPGDNDMARD